MTDIVEALLEVQKEIQNPPTTGDNPFTNSKYAPLPDILNQIRPLLTKNGIVLVQNTGSCPDGSLFVQTRLLFSNGNGLETIESDKLILTPDGNKKRSEVQAIGSAITYGRRYQLLALLNIAGENEDDDGEGKQPQKQNHSQNNPAKKTPKTSKTSKTGKKPNTGKKVPKTAQKSEEAETTSVIEGEARRWKTIADKNPAIKIVCDTLSNAGLEICEANIQAQAEEMNTKKTLTDAEYNIVQVILGKAPG